MSDSKVKDEFCIFLDGTTTGGHKQLVNSQICR